MLGPISVGVKVITIARIRIVIRIDAADFGLFSLPCSPLLLLPRRHGGEGAKDVETRDTASLTPAGRERPLAVKDVCVW
eukprot:scaffold27548_cov45-Cyclotella_meneghiniana.AAC.8